MWRSARLAAEELGANHAGHCPLEAARKTAGDCVDTTDCPRVADDRCTVCGCLREDPASLTRMVEIIRRVSRQVARRFRLPEDRIDDLAGQTVSMLLEPTESGPRLLAYAGRGTLAGYVQAIMMRLAARQVSAELRQVESEREALVQQTVAGDEELAHIRRLYQPLFDEVLRRAVRELSVHDHAVLRLHFVERLSFEQIARVYGIHGTTVARKIERLTRALRRRIVAMLAERLGASHPDVESVLRLVMSQIATAL